MRLQKEAAMRAYVDRVAAVLHRDAHLHSTRGPRGTRPRRARTTFVPVTRDIAYAH
jgi:hypothetical protein